MADPRAPIALWRSVRALPEFWRLLELRTVSQFGDGLFQAGLAGGLLFNPERAARLLEYHARQPTNYPSLDNVFDKILTETVRANVNSGYEGEIQRTVNSVVLTELMTLAANERASNQVRAIAELQLEGLRGWASTQANQTRDQNQRAFLFYVAIQIKRFQDDPKKMNLTRPNDPPDGQPIGSDWWAMAEGNWCDWR